MKCVAFTVVLLGLLACSYAAQTKYTNYKVYQVTPKTPEEVDILRSFQKINGHVDFWSKARAIGISVDVMVSPDFQNTFVYTLNHHKIHFIELIEDVEKVFQTERLQNILAKRVDKGKISFTKYHRYDVIRDYLESLAAEYDFVSLSTPATTTEGRPLVMVKIATGGSTKKPIIFVDGTIHAREWITPSMVLYIINQLVENPNNKNMIENVDWLLIPVLNPDGYEYSHTDERLWRKTRSPGNWCDGVDGNRNFDFHWMETGASDYECDETFAGKIPFSEPEMRAIKTVSEQYGDQIKLYLTFHSYGQYLLYPWGYTSSLPSDWEELDALAVDVDDAIAAVDGTRYEIGSSTNVLYAAAGGSDDWMKGVGGVQLSYTIELPGGGMWGFDLPPSRIDPVVKETWQGVIVYHAYIENKFVTKN